MRYSRRQIGYLIIAFLVAFALFNLAYQITHYHRATPAQDAQTEKREVITQMIKKMSTKQKVEQLFMAQMPVGDESQVAKTWQPGGYYILAQNVTTKMPSKDDWINMVNQIQANSKIPMIIASDEEGGTVTRLSQDSGLVDHHFLSPQQVFANGGWDGITSEIRAKDHIIKSLGVNTNLDPVVDVSSPGSFIYDRTIGMGTAGTEKFAKTVVTQMKKDQVGSTLKHFPGYGDNDDTHTESTHDSRTRKQLDESFKPFTAGIEAGADSILVSHNIIDTIDSDAPASFSPKIHQVIRKNLNFDGVVMTDGLGMAGAVSYASGPDAAYLAVKAGNDMVLSDKYAEQVPYLVEQVKAKKLSEGELNQHVRRILTWKQNLGLIAASGK
jgi:beta-N-acetylhexosaminidase